MHEDIPWTAVLQHLFPLGQMPPPSSIVHDSQLCANDIHAIDKHNDRIMFESNFERGVARCAPMSSTYLYNVPDNQNFFAVVA